MAFIALSVIKGLTKIVSTSARICFLFTSYWFLLGKLEPTNPCSPEKYNIFYFWSTIFLFQISKEGINPFLPDLMEYWNPFRICFCSVHTNSLRKGINPFLPSLMKYGIYLKFDWGWFCSLYNNSLLKGMNSQSWKIEFIQKFSYFCFCSVPIFILMKGINIHFFFVLMANGSNFKLV